MRKAHILGSTMLGLPSFAVFAMAGEVDERLKALRAEVTALNEQIDAMVAEADEADVDLSDEQLEQIEGLKAKIEAKQKQIVAREGVAATRATAGRHAASEPLAPTPGVQAVTPRISGGKGGYKSFGEFARAVRAGSVPGASLDQRLQAAATTYGNEGTGADGGFLVPTEFRRDIWQKVLAEDSLAARCDQLVTGGNNLTVPADETTPWDTTNGIQVYWDSEAATITASKAAFENKSIRLNKLTALVPVTEELLEDAPGLDSYLRARAPIKMQSKLNTAILRGTGVGQPLGVLNAGSLITAAAEGGQSADTILYPNILKMWSRMYAPCRSRAVWLVNQDCEPQLNALAFDATASPKIPVYLPANGLAGSPYATLMGRPVVPVEACSTLGDVGDIMLVDLSQYAIMTKGQDIRTDVSMHLYFDQAVAAYRFIFRVTGMPWWGSTISPQFGTATRSWAVALAAR